MRGTKEIRGVVQKSCMVHGWGRQYSRSQQLADRRGIHRGQTSDGELCVRQTPASHNVCRFVPNGGRFIPNEWEGSAPSPPRNERGNKRIPGTKKRNCLPRPSCRTNNAHNSILSFAPSSAGRRRNKIPVCLKLARHAELLPLWLFGGRTRTLDSIDIRGSEGFHCRRNQPLHSYSHSGMR